MARSSCRTCLPRLSGRAPVWAAASLLSAAWFTSAAPAGSGDYLIDVWTGENGLPNSSVTAIAQTPDGYLWVGTYNGLARFDGVRFVEFDPDNTPELKRSRVRRLHLDASGTLWINTYDGSLTSYRDRRFRLEWMGDGSADATVSLVSSRSNQPVFLLHTGELIRRRAENRGQRTEDRSQKTEERWDVLRPPGASSGELCVEDATGTLWCRGRDQKLWRFAGERFEPAPTNCGLQGQVINTLVVDNRGRLWAGTEMELAVWDGSRFQDMSPTNGEPTLDVSFLYLCEDGAAWVIGNGRVRKARARQWVQEAEACRGVFTGRLDRIGVQEDRRGGAWLYHYGKGIFHLRPTGQTRQIADEENFPGERVDCFFQDREANLWAGVDRGGLVRLREKRFTVWAPDDSPAKAAVSVAEDAQGGVWIGTYGAGLYRWHDGAWQSFGVPEGTRRGFVFSVCPDRAGRLWASVGEEDLFMGVQGQFQPVTPAVHGVKALLAARDGRVWIGTKSRLFCWSERETQQLQSIEGVSRTDVRALAEDTQGVIWAGMGDGTLYRVESNRVASFRPKDQWATQPIWSLSADPDGSVWAGTFRGGLLRFRDGNFIRYTTKQGLPDDVICQILDDEEGRLWLGSQQGIFCVEKSDLNNCAQGKARAVNCTAYGRYDGLPSLECSGSYQPAAWRGHDGRLFFATLRGVVSVRPEDLSSNRLPPPVVIERVLVDGQRAEDKAGKQVFGDSSLDVVEVGPGKRQLEFQYTGLSFVSPDRVRFRYQLDGFDKDWVEAGSRRWVQYGFLRPGTYTFRVKACNNDGVWNSRGASLLLRVSPHFYETTWFLGLAGCAIIGGVAAGARAVSTRKYRRALALLEQQHAIERDRARIARDIHDDLGAGLTRITLLSELARREPPDQAGGHLDRISSSARELTRTMDEIVWAVDPQHDTLNGLMDYASAYTEDYLRLAGIRCRMDLPSALPLVQVAAESRYNLFLALKEALNNIVKHAHASEVWLRLRLAPGTFTLVLEDSGQGLATASPSSNNPGGNAESGERLYSGHGLGNLEQRLAAIGGSCTVRSAPGQGTRIEMTIHLPGRASPIVATGQNGDGHSQ